MLRGLTHDDLEEARALLLAACPFDRAHAVAEEKLFGPAPGCTTHGLAAMADGRLAGLVVTSGAWIRILAVHPAHRGHGVGSALLAAAEAEISRAGMTRVRVLDQPGNYLAPGIDVRNQEAIAWLARRGYAQHGDNCNLLVDVRANPRVSEVRARELGARLAGYEIRRARSSDEHGLGAMIQASFSATWSFEVSRALAGEPACAHLALHQGEIVAFAAHDGNNRGLGWFGPTGTLPEHRGRGLGEALLGACLVDVARAGLDTCEIAWIGPRSFYERTVGVAGERRFAVMRKELS